METEELPPLGEKEFRIVAYKAAEGYHFRLQGRGLLKFSPSGNEEIIFATSRVVKRGEDLDELVKEARETAGRFGITQTQDLDEMSWP